MPHLCIRSTYPSHLILLHLFTLLVLCEGYKLWSSFLIMQFPPSSSCHSLSVRSTFSPQHPVLKLLQLCSKVTVCTAWTLSSQPVTMSDLGQDWSGTTWPRSSHAASNPSNFSSLMFWRKVRMKVRVLSTHETHILLWVFLIWWQYDETQATKRIGCQTDNYEFKRFLT
jgi:hypothetical protein